VKTELKTPTVLGPGLVLNPQISFKYQLANPIRLVLDHIKNHPKNGLFVDGPPRPGKKRLNRPETFQHLDLQIFRRVAQGQLSYG
jgi:hypothetical protein